MTFDWKASAIEQLQSHWSDILRPRLNGLTDDEYFWEPVPNCWTIHPRAEQRSAFQAGKGDLVYDFELPEPDPVPVTTIAWRLGHIASGCLAVRAANHFGTPVGEAWWEDIEWPSTADDALAYLDASYDQWVAGIKSLDDDAMAQPVGPSEGPWKDMPYLALVLHINREVIHHGAEIALLRDLYRAR
jgi:hypothetical protein